VSRARHSRVPGLASLARDTNLAADLFALVRGPTIWRNEPTLQKRNNGGPRGQMSLRGGIGFQQGQGFLHCGHELRGRDDGRVLLGRDFGHGLERAQLKRHGMLGDDIGGFTAAWYSPSAATILARRSRSASASL